jgi:hypothetical protein
MKKASVTAKITFCRKTDAEGEDENRQKDRFGDREEQMQRRREHAVGRQVLAQKESDREPERPDDRECHRDLGERNAEIAAEALVMEEAGERAQHLGERRQQPRIGEAEPARHLPQRREQRDEDEGRKPDEPPRHDRRHCPISAMRTAGMRWCRCLAG